MSLQKFLNEAQIEFHHTPIYLVSSVDIVEFASAWRKATTAYAHNTCYHFKTIPTYREGGGIKYMDYVIEYNAFDERYTYVFHVENNKTLGVYVGDVVKLNTQSFIKPFHLRCGIEKEEEKS